MSIFDTIRDQANLKKAEAIRFGSGQSLRDQCLEASKKQMAGVGEAQLDNFVDTLLSKSAGIALKECIGLVPELGVDNKEAEQARKAIVDSAVMSGQYLKATVKNTLRPIIDNLHLRVADTVSVIATEATIVSLTNPALLQERGK